MQSDEWKHECVWVNTTSTSHVLSTCKLCICKKRWMRAAVSPCMLIADDAKHTKKGGKGEFLPEITCRVG